MIAALPHWRFKDIESLPMSIVEMAAEAANERRDEDNRFQAALHGMKLPEKRVPMSANSIKATLANMPKGIKTVKRSDLAKAS